METLTPVAALHFAVVTERERERERERDVNCYINELAKGIQNPPDIDFIKVGKTQKTFNQLVMLREAVNENNGEHGDNCHNCVEWLKPNY